MIAIYKKLSCIKHEREKVTLGFRGAFWFYFDKFAKLYSAYTNTCQHMVSTLNIDFLSLC